MTGAPAVNAYDAWNQRWTRLREACRAHGATDRWLEGQGRAPRFEVGPPATVAEVERVEAVLGHRLPSALREVVLGYASAVSIQWQLPDAVKPPGELSVIFAGECRWSLEELPALVEEHRSWVEKVFSNPADAYDAVWHGKLPILSVVTGDMIAIQLNEKDPAVIYLSRDDGCHGYRLGDDFIDYVDRLSRLGCPGAEDWQWVPFVEGPRSGLLPDSANGVRWRDWFKIG